MPTEAKSISITLELPLYKKLQEITSITHRSFADQVRFWIDTFPETELRNK